VRKIGFREREHPPEGCGEQQGKGQG
jgi:hypothetical protein